MEGVYVIIKSLSVTKYSAVVLQLRISAFNCLTARESSAIFTLEFKSASS